MSIDNPAFAPVDLMSADLEIDSSIYKGFAAAIMVKGQPRMIALCREYPDAVQLMAIIDASRAPAADADRVRREIKAWTDTQFPKSCRVGSAKWINGLTDRILAALKSEGK